jgi:hypothetical protein
MSSTTTSSPASTTSREALEIIELKPGLRFGKQVLIDLLPDVETALFFGKVYELDAKQLGVLLSTVFRNSTVIQALTAEGGQHSVTLQDYVVDLTTQIQGVDKQDVTFNNKVVPKGEILPELWKQLEVEVASSIKDVAAKLASVVGLMPGKQGEMAFRSMRVLNAKRPILGDYKAQIKHAPQKPNLVILDDSGSVSRETVSTIVDDVVALSYLANAHFALVSNTTRHWEPGTYGTDDILAKVENGGTHYETLLDLMNEDWGVVVCIADYDSSASAKGIIARATGTIDQCIDVSLVDSPTFLAEVVGQKARSVKPILVASQGRSFCNNRW